MNEQEAIEYFNNNFTYGEVKHVIDDYEGIIEFIGQVFRGEMSHAGYRQRSPVTIEYREPEPKKTLLEIASEERP